MKCSGNKLAFLDFKYSTKLHSLLILSQQYIQSNLYVFRIVPFHPQSRNNVAKIVRFPKIMCCNTAYAFAVLLSSFMIISCRKLEHKVQKFNQMYISDSAFNGSQSAKLEYFFPLISKLFRFTPWNGKPELTMHEGWKSPTAHGGIHIDVNNIQDVAENWMNDAFIQLLSIPWIVAQ